MSDAPEGLDEFLSEGKVPAEGNRMPSNHAYPEGLEEFIAPELNEQKYGGVSGALKAFGLGAARSASFGTSDQFFTRTGLMTPEEIKAYKETNPTATPVGEVAGILGAIAAPETGILGALSAPVKAVSRIGGAVTEAAAPAIEGLVGSAANPTIGKVLGQAAGHALGSIAEGEFYTTGNAVSENALGDPDALGEKLLGHLGPDALLYGSLGALIGGGKEIIPRALEKAGVKTQAVGETLGKVLAKASSVVSGKAYEDIAPLTKGIGTAEGAAMRRSAREGFKERESTARELADGLAEQHDAVSKATKDYYEGARPEEISKLMGEVPYDRAFDAASNLSGKLRDVTKVMRQDPEIYSSVGRVKKLENIRDGFEKRVLDATKSEEIYHAVNDAKGQIQDLTKWGGAPVPAEADTVNAIKDIGREFRTHLENPAIYGEAGARQGALNSAYSEFASASKDFTKAFGKKLASGELKIDPGKVNTFLGQMGRPGADIKQQILADYLEASQGLTKQMGETSKNAVSKIDTDKLMDLFKKTQGIAEGAESELEAVNQLKRLKTFGEGGHGLGGAAAVGAAAHLMGVPITLAEGAYGVYHTLKNPAEMVRILSAVETATQKVSNAINKGSSAIFKIGEGAEALKSYGAEKYNSSEDRRNNHDKFRPELSDLASNPEKLIAHLTKNTDVLNQVAPKTAASVQGAMVRATQFLQQKLPQGGPQKPLSPKYIPSDAELAKWHKYYSAIETPTNALHDVARGTLVPETMEALSAVYPKMLSEMQSSVMDKMTTVMAKEKLIPYRTKLSLSMFLGSDMVNSLDPKSMLANQNTMSTATQAHQAQQSGQINRVNKSGVAKMDKSNRFLTNSQLSAQRQEA